MADTPQRETAKICTIKELQEGEYVVQEGWLPNYVLSDGRKLSRVNIIGIVVSKQSPYEFSLDDGSGTISVTDFNQTKKVSFLKVGEPVLIIGRPRQNNNNIFIACELVNSKQLKEQAKWMTYRKEELLARPKETNTLPEKKQTVHAKVVENLVEEKQSLDSPEKIIQPIQSEEKISGDVTGEDIIDFIKKKDTADGCLIEDIISYFGKDIDDHILTLITMGEIYEIKPGKVKVLE